MYFSDLLDFIFGHFSHHISNILQKILKKFWVHSATEMLKFVGSHVQRYIIFNLLTPNVEYSGRTAPLTSKCCILYIYSTNICTENFKHGLYSLFFLLQNAVCFINLTYLIPVLVTFYIQSVLKLKKVIPAPKG